MKEPTFITSEVVNDPLFFFDESESGGIARSIDWSKHPLGAAEFWPNELKTILSILFRSGHPMFLFWGEDLFCFYNDAFKPSFGLGKPPKAMGQKGAECWSEIWPIIKPQIDQVMQKGNASWHENHLFPFFRNGRIDEIYWTYSYSPILQSNGQAAGVLVTCTETTNAVLKERQLRESEERLNLALVSGNIGFWDWNAVTNQVIISRTLMDDWGIDPATYKNSFEECLACLHPDDRERIQNQATTALEKQMPYDVEYRVIRPSGELIWVHAVGRSYADEKGVPQRVTGITRNITSQKIASTQLESARRDAERANQIKSAFLANMSHEIRTPLGVILGFTDLLRDTGLNLEERNQFLDTISRNGRALTQIIDDILDLSKVEANRLELENIEFSFFELLDEVSTLFKDRAKSKGLYLLLNITPDVPQRITSDPARLRQILVNIIGNAVKFTAHGGVSISVKAKKNTANYAITIEVTDTGIGLTSEQITRLFEPFTQADSSMNRRFGGTGLGLVLSRKLARAFGGDIKIERSTTKGSTFSIIFPTAQIHDVTRQIEPNTFRMSLMKNNVQGMKVLMAEDAADNQLLIKRVLEQVGICVDVANNGLDALKRALEINYDAVLMDIQMPVMDGYEAARHLRAAGFKKPIIALTAHAMTEERARTEAAGCNQHLTKPIDFKELLAVLEAIRNA